MPAFKKNKNRHKCEGYNFGLILYQEHFATQQDVVKFILNKYKTSYCISPLHNRDLKDKAENDNDFKKEHYHVILHYLSKKSLSTVQSKIDGLGLSEVVDNIAIMTRYLTHVDDPDKAQYNQSDVIFGYGYKYDKYYHMLDDEDDKFEIIFNIINQNEISSGYKLVQFLRTSSEFKYLQSFVAKKAYYFNTMYFTKK